MKLLIITLFALIAITYAEDKYTTKYDGVDIDEILKSDRLFNNYFKCLNNTGRCSPDGSELKRLLPDALKTNCSKCSDKQRSGTDRVIRYLIEKKTDQWNQLQKLYDPENIYINQYKKEAESRGIKL